MRTVEVVDGNLRLSDEVVAVIEKEVTKFGTGAKVDCPRKFLGKRVYLVICEKGREK
ncbi:MAG: DUF2080 family transposase-associated protein [Thermoplasmata archaeon]|nr:DUF2080 family transposase-associated protein [Candidatus Sysuiplasma jiujiangense]MBX8640308.1 DUF2080 family transposase-associated protein [Candidatus Sysuiplasma jiujiangense]MBX8641989.1 DUF2080 family transposase-associated protein [Candidatus Sysuiplasma jiujiangense]